MTRPTHTATWTITRNDEEIDVSVDYVVDDYARPASGHFGPPEHYDPGNGWLFAIEPVTSGGFTLTDAEIDAIHEWLSENHEEDDDYDY